MNQTERIEKLLVEWEAVNRKMSREFCKKGRYVSEGVRKGLKLALDIIKEPNTTGCIHCIKWRNLEMFTYCPDCGKPLHHNSTL